MCSLQTSKLIDMLEFLIKLAADNQNASECLTGIIDGSTENAVAGLAIIPKINKCHIIGNDLDTFYTKICNRNYELMAYLCKSVPNETLKIACSKSSIEVLSNWINSFKESNY